MKQLRAIGSLLAVICTIASVVGIVTRIHSPDTGDEPLPVFTSHSRYADNPLDPVNLGHANVLRELKDPDSARFRNEVRTSRAYCGSVKSNSGFGGHTGYQRFYTIGGAVRFDDDTPGFDTLYDAFCKE
ncbi:hypothetical protein DSC91_002526 [Paraburkholderia caffeinilytica]|uniref:Uncharacterized protein n=1 Tax=Paraburkholderia caffeinilytica TaxID=1761016 RepID=A0ABQ1NJ52_9BURK|nr:hypothetical protein [Paraburkholderia caffeinilytica]AXL50363.1 hypothetical protein DSC91_002526 [Paraburkholderia caffeinilytica]GGC67588.1 hypothetical protein GCM10011400_64350 [Paraburkholderia caffeinilytica]CAB3804296.1 hypothetical protein LMG28690_05993 [Paraburkholderia caffeinilytica]